MATVIADVDMETCPFCGHAPQLKSDELSFKPHFWVKCSNNKCRVSTMATFEQESAMELWNDRSMRVP